MTPGSRLAVLAVLLAGPAFAGAAPSAPDTAPAPTSTVFEEFFRVSLKGDPASASPFVEERLGVIPFGRWLNAIPVTKVKYGVQFSAQLDHCSSHGCVMETEDVYRLMVAKRGIADGIRLDIYDKGWRRRGSAAISEGGQVAIPVISPESRQEVWVIRKNGRMRTRLTHDIRNPVVLRWHQHGLFLVYQAGERLRALRADFSSATFLETDLMDAWWRSCRDDDPSPLAVGMIGEIPERLAGATSVPLYRKGEETPGVLVLTTAVRPMTTQGFAEPVRIQVDCFGRFNVVTAGGDDTWCLRFGPDGVLQRASKVGVNIAGDAKAIRLDQRGRFFFLDVEFEGDSETPTKATLVRLE